MQVDPALSRVTGRSGCQAHSGSKLESISVLRPVLKLIREIAHWVSEFPLATSSAVHESHNRNSRFNLQSPYQLKTLPHRCRILI